MTRSHRSCQNSYRSKWSLTVLLLACSFSVFASSETINLNIANGTMAFSSNYPATSNLYQIFNCNPDKYTVTPAYTNNDTSMVLTYSSTNEGGFSGTGSCINPITGNADYFIDSISFLINFNPTTNIKNPHNPYTCQVNVGLYDGTDYDRPDNLRINCHEHLKQSSQPLPAPTPLSVIPIICTKTSSHGITVGLGSISGGPSGKISCPSGLGPKS